MALLLFSDQVDLVIDHIFGIGVLDISCISQSLKQK